jgi:hypothetical protein
MKTPRLAASLQLSGLSKTSIHEIPGAAFGEPMLRRDR